MPAVENGRTLSAVVTELKEELRNFAQTRIQMLRSELRQKKRAWGAAVPAIAVGLVLVATAWLVLTAALIALIAIAFYPNHFAYVIALAIVGVAYLLAGGLCAAFAVRVMKEQGVMPKRTIRVLKDDATWLQAEARNQI